MPQTKEQDNPALLEIRRLLKRLPLFADAAPDILDMLVSQGHVLPCGRGKLLFVQGDKAEASYLIQSGHVKLFRESGDGDEVVLDIPGAGQIFGETALFNDNAYPFSAEILDSAVLFTISLPVLDRLIGGDIAFCRAMLAHMAQKDRMKDGELERRALQEAPQKIGCFLLQICAPQTAGKAAVTLPYDKITVAARLGMRPETFSRALLKLRTDLGLTIDGTAIEIGSIEALSHYVCAACSSAYPCDSR